MRFRMIAAFALSSAVGLSAAYSAQLDPQQMAMIKETAISICNTVKEIKGEKTDAQIQGEVKGQLGGLLGRISGAEANVSGTGVLSREAFDGLTQDATATALVGDRECRMTLFDEMFDKITATTAGTTVQSGNCSIATGGNATSNSVNCGSPPVAPAAKP